MITRAYTAVLLLLAYTTLHHVQLSYREPVILLVLTVIHFLILTSRPAPVTCVVCVKMEDRVRDR